MIEFKRKTLSPLKGKVGGIKLMEDRYYVQRLSEQIFLIRERMSADKEPGPDDQIIRSFDIRFDADIYADNANNMQRKLDERYGHWVQKAI
jgi:hypothetical protein